MIRTLVVFACVIGLQAQPDYVLEKGRAGRAKVGMSVDELYQAYGWENTKLVDLFGEGMFQPVIEIYLGGVKSLVAEVEARKGFTVWRIAVHDKRFRTVDGIGIGSTLGELKQRYPVKMLGGEGAVPVAWVESLGLSFFLGGRQSFIEPAKAPDDARITSVLVVQQLK
jgi:hypothetical protein